MKEKKKSKMKGFALGMALVLAMGAAGTSLVMGIKNNGWFAPDNQEEEELPLEENGGAVINESASNGIKVMSTKIQRAAYAEYDISPQAETAYTLTATITPFDANNKAVDWSVSWVNANSTFASGKSVTDYVTVTPTSDGALTSNVECKQAFGEKIKITVTSRDNSDVKAECTVDYAQKVTVATLSYGNIDCMENDFTSVAFLCGSDVEPNGGEVAFDYDVSSVYTLAENFDISVHADIFFQEGSLEYFNSLSFKDTAFLDDMQSAIVDSNSKEIYFNYSFFLDYLVFGASNLSFEERFAKKFLSGISALDNPLEVFYITVNVSLNGDYSDYTYTTKLCVGSYERIAAVTGVSMDKSNLVF